MSNTIFDSGDFAEGGVGLSTKEESAKNFQESFAHDRNGGIVVPFTQTTWAAGGGWGGGWDVNGPEAIPQGLECNLGELTFNKLYHPGAGSDDPYSAPSSPPTSPLITGIGYGPYALVNNPPSELEYGFIFHGPASVNINYPDSFGGPPGLIPGGRFKMVWGGDNGANGYGPTKAIGTISIFAGGRLIAVIDGSFIQEVMGTAIVDMPGPWNFSAIQDGMTADFSDMTWIVNQITDPNGAFVQVASGSGLPDPSTRWWTTFDSTFVEGDPTATPPTQRHLVFIVGQQALQTLTGGGGAVTWAIQATRIQ